MLLALLWAGPAGAQLPIGDALPFDAQLPADTFDVEALRVALERELAVPVQRVDGPSNAHLSIRASALADVRLSFVREDGSRVERAVDVSKSGVHTNETLALVAANLMADEAADLLAALRATSPPLEPPQPTAAEIAARDAGQGLPVPPAAPPMRRGCAENDLKKRYFGADVIPYGGMSTKDGTTVERGLSLGLFGTLSGGIRGFELSGFGNLVDQSVCGVQVTGGVNLVNGPVEGGQFGMINGANGRLDGTQIGLLNGAVGPLIGAQAGLVNLAAGDITGAQLSLVNIGSGSLTGLQAGLANAAPGPVVGAQLGLASFAGGTVRGLQLGLSNIAVERLAGAQLGLFNLTSSRVQGTQIGLVNIAAGRVDGLMLGLVNTAENADTAIGVVNVLWNGRTNLDLWTNELGMAMLGVVHGSRYVHNITAVGIGRRDNRAVFAPAYGIGVRFADHPVVSVDLDALSQWFLLFDEDRNAVDHAFIGTLRLPVAFRLTSWFALFAAPSFNVSIAEGRDSRLRDPTPLDSKRLSKVGASTEFRVWPGLSLGARFF